MLPLISVVIPVYNIEKYVDDCLKSVINQTYTNIEVIVVDDGSTDNSGKICDSYATKSNRIKVIHQQNGGLSVARNTGIDASKGEYITFIDGDDYVANTYVEFLFDLIKDGADISICEFNYVYGDKIRKCKSILRHGKLEMSSHEALRIMLYQNYFDTAAWGKLYKRKLFVGGIRYPVGRLFEDMGTTYRLFLEADKVIYENVSKYYYVQRNDSISNAKYDLRKDDYLKFAEEVYEAVKLKAPECTNAAASRVVSVAAHLTMEMFYENDNDEMRCYRHEKYNIIKKYREKLLFDMKIRLRNKCIVLISYTPFCIYDYLLKISYNIYKYICGRFKLCH